MTRDEIQRYWNARAEERGTSRAATTDDVYLRELETTTIVDALIRRDADHGDLLDVGCGDGYSSLRIAAALPYLRIRGIDYSEAMIRLALANLEDAPGARERVSFSVGDVTALDRSESDSTYSVALSDRCLINLESYDSQRTAVAQIAHRLRPGGWYVAIENFLEGQQELTEARRAVGLPEIPIRWHNLFFDEASFRRACEPFFSDIEIVDFSSSYYFATRVIYSGMCAMRGEEPDYRHEIHRLAIRLPWVGRFSPIRMAVMRRTQ
jgi:SAM-dependent methyltransferase